MLASEMQLLTKHVGSNQRESGLGHAETAFAIVIVIFADDRAVRNTSAAINDGAVNAAIPADIEIGRASGRESG